VLLKKYFSKNLMHTSTEVMRPNEPNPANIQISELFIAQKIQTLSFAFHKYIKLMKMKLTTTPENTHSQG